MGECVERRGPIDQRRSRHPILDDKAERFVADGLVVIVQKERRVAVGNADFQDRLGIGGHRRPDANAVQHPLGAERDGGHATIERRVAHRRRIGAVDHHRLEPGVGERDPDGQPDQTTADDNDVGVDALVRLTRHCLDHVTQP